MRFLNRLFAVFGCIALVLAAAAPSLAKDPTAQDVAAKALPSIVLVVANDASGSPDGFGSGVVVGKNLIVTCWHVVAGAHSVTVGFSDDRSANCPGVVDVDFQHDLAILIVPTKNVKPLALASIPPIGTPVVAIGNPKGFTGTVSTGVVSGVRDLNFVHLVQTTAPISPGSSGGALLDLQGNVVGIVKEYFEGQNLNFAVDPGYVKQMFPVGDPAGITWDELASIAPPTPDEQQPPPADTSPEKTAVPADPTKAKPEADFGDALYAKKNYAEAETHYRTAVLDDPGNARYQDGLGECLAEQDRYSDAEPFLRQAVQLDPKTARYQSDAGQTLYAELKFSDAEPFYREAARLDPQNATLQDAVGNLLYVRKKYADAEPFYRTAVRLDASNAQYQDDLADVLAFENKLAEAETCYQQAVRLSPQSPTYKADLENCVAALRPKAATPAK